MEHTGTTAGEKKIILTSAAGATVRDAAKQAGVSERSHRRRKDAEFRRAVFEAQGRMLDANRGRLAGLASKAVETLDRLLESDEPAVVLAAVKAVLELGPRLRKSMEFEERINGLEDQADENIDENRTPADEEELVLALAAGAAVQDRAEQTGEQTADSRWAEADFRQAVSQARGWLLQTALGQLASLGGKATGILERLMESDEPSVARRAAKIVLQVGPRLRESTELKERMSRLEEADENPAAAIIGNG